MQQKFIIHKGHCATELVSKVQKEEIENYQVKMIQNQEDFFCCQLKIQEECDTSILHWIIRDGKPFIDTIKGTLMSGESYLIFLWQLMSKIRKGREYLIDDDNWLLDLDYIMNAQEPLVIYLPWKTPTLTLRDRWKVLLNRLLQYVDIGDPLIRQVNQQLQLIVSEIEYSVFDIEKALEVRMANEHLL